MRYVSTRDTSKHELSYAEALLAGLAPDGGLYVPISYPELSRSELAALAKAPYTDIAFAVKQKFIGGDIPDEALRALIVDAYSPESFQPITAGTVVPLSRIDDDLYIEELSLGPTAAFKDVAMQLLGREMDFVLRKRGEHLTILGATSGDTGSAAEAAFKGLECVSLIMLSPAKGMSAFQKAQMGNLSGGNVTNVSVRGTFDDCQDLVKLLKREQEFAHLGAVNSINWGRISAQIPYYLSGYLQAARTIGDPVDMCVPSGNFGNVLSGYIARAMGVPIRRLVVATNENSVLDTLIRTGTYTQTKTQTTSSPSMDISKASNYERLAYDLFGRDAARLAAYMREFESTGTVAFASHCLPSDTLLAVGFRSGASTHADRLRSIKETYERAGRLIDTHTADAMTVALREKEVGVPMLVMSTALPVKFEDSIRQALGFVPPRPARFANVESYPDDAFSEIEVDADALRSIVRAADPR